MPDNDAETGAAKKTSEGGSATDNAAAKATEQAEKPLTRTELLTILADHRNGINADIRKATTKPPDKKADEVDTTLTARVARMEDREKKLNERERLSAVKTALVQGGVPPTRVDREARLILMDHDSAIQVDDKTFNVTYRESEDKTTPISDWVGAFLKTDSGKDLIPPKATNGAVDNGSGVKAGSQPHPFLKLTYKQIMDHPDYSARQAFVKQHPDEWAKKKAER